MTSKGSGFSRTAQLLYPLALFVLVCSLFFPALSGHWKLSLDPFYFSDDVLQQVVPFLKYHDGELFNDDYSTDYHLAAVPAGFRLLYGSLSRIWDPLVFTRGIHFLLLSLVLTGVFLAAFRLSGYTGAFLAVVICLSADIYFVKMTGGLPRAFAYPLFSLGAAALVWGRVRLFAVLTLLAAAFYPLVAVIFCVALGLTLLFLPARDRGEGKEFSMPKRMLLLLAVGLGVGLIALPPVMDLKPFGPSVKPSEIDIFPEAGPGGRLMWTDHPPFAGFLDSAQGYVSKSFASSGKPFSAALRAFAAQGKKDGPFYAGSIIYEVYFLLCLFGFVQLLRTDGGSRRFLVLFLSAWATHALSRLAIPALFIPDRYVVYSLPPLLAIGLPAALGGIGGYFVKPERSAWAGPLVILLLGGLFLGFFGGKGSTDAGLKVYVPRDVRPFYDYVRTLPKNAVIAGLPDGPVNYIPYLSRRKVLISFETHQVFYAAYALEMRRRMRALVNAYYATTMAPLVQLRKKFGVSHLLISRTDFEQVPAYFVPYNGWLEKGFQDVEEEGSQALELIDAAGVYSFRDYVLLDLGELKFRPKAD